MNVARALMEGLQAQRTRDEISVLRYALAQDWDDGLQTLLADSLTREEIILDETGGHPLVVIEAVREIVLDEPPAIVWHAPTGWIAEAA
jgi:hypothetical protein